MGVDVSESMLEVARSKCPELKLVCQDITQESLNRNFDVITAFRFFRNAEPGLRLAALTAIHDHLQTDGYLIANIHGNPFAPGVIALKAKSLFKRIPANSISSRHFTRLLEQNGFEIVERVNYSYLPRFSSFFPRWYARLMGPVEKICKSIPIIKGMSESTLFVARKKG